MGAAFYALDGNILAVDTKDILNVNDNKFAKPDPSDEKLPAGDFYGMDTSNVAEVTPGVGIGFVIFRNATGGDEVDRGSGIIRVTLGTTVPIATRVGPLITGADGIQVGITSILAAEGYIYVYTNYGPNGLMVGRAKCASAFSASSYKFRTTFGSWVTGIPTTSNMNNYGSYMFFVGGYGYDMSFHTSDAPYGPWSDEYRVAEAVGYGIDVHLEFSPDGDHSVLYVSSGAADGITMRKIEFRY
ncbi:uncharacterized protein RCO7_07082 [Rhynchosporium graminicola]|uniref:Uncharacterized protein n=1 Tax=Rhynchosporium graminicola TaxID=2792576 RepID=A0A1E1K4G3_9HELO|nr:uncharacterized protein RCO7_07082 [Rhynchosporium commune]